MKLHHLQFDPGAQGASGDFSAGSADQLNLAKEFHKPASPQSNQGGESAESISQTRKRIEMPVPSAFLKSFGPKGIAKDQEQQQDPVAPAVISGLVNSLSSDDLRQTFARMQQSVGPSFLTEVGKYLATKPASTWLSEFEDILAGLTLPSDALRVADGVEPPSVIVQKGNVFVDGLSYDKTRFVADPEAWFQPANTHVPEEVLTALTELSELKKSIYQKFNDLGLPLILH